MQIKELKRALGVLTLGVIGRVTPWNDGKTIIETGKGVESGGWEKSGHIVLTSEEREELIDVLKSHRDYRRVEIGDVVGGPVAATVMAVSYREDGTGVVLAHSEHKREYWVWTIDAKGEVHNGSSSFDGERARNKYAVRVTESLFLHYNTTPPTLTFAHVADRDKLKSDA
jgi:hypothetical protein